MPFGYQGRIAFVELSSSQVEQEAPDDAFYRAYLGGRGVALYYLLTRLEPGVDALDERNVLVFASGLLTGAPAPAVPKFTVASRSPLTGCFGEAEAGGSFGAALKSAGYDALVVAGRAPQPCYIAVLEGKIYVRPASHLWGRTTGETELAIRDELGDEQVKVACIGPAGENLVRYACVMHDLRHAAGRTGLGAVMGSKNLKAVAVRGSGRIACKDPEAVRGIARSFARDFPDNPLTRVSREQGTWHLIASLNAAGILPTRNFETGYFETADRLDATALSRFEVGRRGCHACPVGCKHVVACPGPGREVDPAYGAPEYETVAAFGPNLGVSDPWVVLKAGELCNALGLDTISAGHTISFAMSCREAGLLGAREGAAPEPGGTGYADLRFGNGEAALAMVESIAARRGLGDLLAEGSARAAVAIGGGASRYVRAVKKQEVPMHDPRGKFAVGMGYALSEIGADHLVVPHDTMFERPESFSLSSIAPLGLTRPMPATGGGPEKVRFYWYLEQLWSAFKGLGACVFGIAPRGCMPIGDLVDLVRACTGWETSLWELMKAGDRLTTLARVFNLRNGVGRPDDVLPEAFFAAIPTGPSQGRAVGRGEFMRALEDYYVMRGWDPGTGVPLRTKLEELGIGWAQSYVDAPDRAKQPSGG